MKHIFIIETVDTISPSTIINLEAEIAAVADANLGEANWMQYSCNENSAIRAVYRLFRADESRSPDESVKHSTINDVNCSGAIRRIYGLSGTFEGCTAENFSARELDARGNG